MKLFGRHEFKAGDRVKPSAEGIAASIFYPKHHTASGVVTRVDDLGTPTVRWDHRKTASTYYPGFIEPDSREASDRLHDGTAAMGGEG